MVRTRATDPKRNNPPPEAGGPSNNKHVAALEARIAQMFRDMEAFTEQNLRLLGWFSGGWILEESDENDGDESNAHVDGDINLESWGVPQDNQPENNSQNDGGLHQKKKRLSEVMASLDEKYNRLQQEVHQQEKGKPSLVDNLLHGTTSPFTDQISEVLLPEKFKIPSIAPFIGIKDPT